MKLGEFCTKKFPDNAFARMSLFCSNTVVWNSVLKSLLMMYLYSALYFISMCVIINPVSMLRTLAILLIITILLGTIISTLFHSPLKKKIVSFQNWSVFIFFTQLYSITINITLYITIKLYIIVYCQLILSVRFFNMFVFYHFFGYRLYFYTIHSKPLLNN